MAEFCSLCGYGDINIEELYDKHIRSRLLRGINMLDKDHFVSVGVGVCERCGLVSFGVDNQYDVYGVYCGKGDQGERDKIGKVDKETLELEIFEDNPRYVQMKLEQYGVELELGLIEMYCLRYNKNRDDLTGQEHEMIGKKFEELLTNL